MLCLALLYVRVDFSGGSVCEVWCQRDVFWPPHCPPARAADCEANKELYRRHIEELWNKRDQSAVERYLAPNYVEHNKNLPPGRDGRWGFVSKVFTAFPDYYHAEIQEVVAEGDRVVARMDLDRHPGRPL